jgi:hypothetical protein
MANCFFFFCFRVTHGLYRGAFSLVPPPEDSWLTMHSNSPLTALTVLLVMLEGIRFASIDLEVANDLLITFALDVSVVGDFVMMVFLFHQCCKIYSAA